MAYDPRTLAYLSEIIHGPLQHDAVRLQSVYNDLFQDARLGYRNFSLVQGGAMLSNPVAQPTQVSSATFLADRIQIREELTDVTLEDFRARVERLAQLSLAKLGIQVVTAQQVVVRSVIQPRHFQDSRKFLGSSMFSLPADRFQAIGRPAQLLGFRAVYPQTPEEPNVFSLRIESFNNDPRSVFVEVVGTFPPVVPGSPLARAADGNDRQAFETLGHNVTATYAFLERRALTFVEQFDQPSPA